MKYELYFLLIFLIFSRKWIYIWIIHILYVLLQSEIERLIMKTIYKKFDKHKIHELPRAVFEGRIEIIDTLEKVDAAIDYLLSQDILGVDTETRPSFKKGLSYEVSLLQVSAIDICYLFRLNKIGMPDAILRLLSDTKVTKVGLSWHDDLRMLHQKHDFEPGNYIDIQDVAQTFGIEDLSLQKIYANLFGKKISKSQRLSNWEAADLRESQKLYAATDAWACIMLYKEFRRLKQRGDYELVVPEELEEPKALVEGKDAEQVEKAEESK